jgi:AcrR family transcriptional regulator
VTENRAKPSEHLAYGAVDERVRDAERSRAAILLAARGEFSEHGLGGARMERIALRAGLDKKLIYYYFAGKDALFGAVLEQVYVDIRDAERRLNLADTQPADAVRRLVEFTWNYYLAHPEFIQLLNSANLHKAKHLNSKERVRVLNSPLVDLLDGILKRGQQAGIFRHGVDPIQLYITIASLAYFFLSNNPTLSVVFGRDLSRPKARQERLSHMTDVVLGYLLVN